MPKKPEILLTSVIGPYGVEDGTIYNGEGVPMELFDCQVTREQGGNGFFSVRGGHPSGNLRFIAANIEYPTTVLDFPAEKRYIREIKKGYDYIGITSIVPNIRKVGRMVRLAREYAPRSKVIVGGHCTSEPDIKEITGADIIVRGEGISALREILGLPPASGALKHPPVKSFFQQSIMGIPSKVPLIGRPAAWLILGGGCVNKCDFCSTSHFFGGKYICFFEKAEDVFDIMLETNKALRSETFFIMDENFLKMPARAEKLLQLMRRYKRPFQLGIFSSAEAIQAVGLKFMFELGVGFLWIGIESVQDNYEKNRGVDIPSLLGDIRKHGIITLASAILFRDHHTKERIGNPDKTCVYDEIEHVIGLRPDFTQFMCFGVYKHTPLGKRMEREGRMIPAEEREYKYRDGQNGIWHRHPEFTIPESKEILDYAFRREYQVLGPSILRAAETLLDGFDYTRRHYAGDPWRDLRVGQIEKSAQKIRTVIPAMIPYLPNETIKTKARKILARYEQICGPMRPWQRAVAAAAHPLLAAGWLRVQYSERVHQPPTTVKKFNY